jgi:hypothetical protein
VICRRLAYALAAVATRGIRASFVLALAATVATAGCGTRTFRATSPRVVASEYQGWTIRVVPTLESNHSNSWRAAVRVWPPDRPADTFPGINVHYSAIEADEATVVRGATDAAKRYIDASQSQSQQ